MPAAFEPGATDLTAPDAPDRRIRVARTRLGGTLGAVAAALTALTLPTGPAAATGTDPTDTAQTSDREPGWIAPPWGRSTAATDSAIRSWSIAPGVRYRVWTRSDTRGQSRIHLVKVDLRKHSVRADLLTNSALTTRAPVSSMVRTRGALVGINGDFFDIYDTGAALGTAAGRRTGALQGRISGTDLAFYQAGGRYRIGTLPLLATIKDRPKITITNVNAAEIDRHGIGLYTAAWGTTSGTAVSPGQRRVREVVIRRSRVVANRRASTGRPIRGRVLVGVGRSATQLKQLKQGRKVSVRFRLAGRPAIAIGGDRMLLRDGERLVVDDTLMHPRTAVGLDASGKRLFLVVVDGRSAASRGHTMVEMADLMSELGALDALNLDGGGSTTLVAPNRKGRIGVRNTPSDGAERAVPNGLGLFRRR